MDIAAIIISIIILLIAGALFGIISSIAGVGGGIFFVSIMVLFFSISINIAIDTSIFIILISSAAGFFTYFKAERLHFKQVIIFSSFSILGGICSTILFLFIELDSTILKILFASTLLIAGINMMYKVIRMKSDKNNQSENDKDIVDLNEHD